ncbi:MAG: hypothetical protein WD489_05745 [Rhodovibrionaceae bacterium]
MKSVGRTCLGAAIVILGLAGLATAATVQSTGVYYAGLLVFLLAVLFVFWLIKLSFDDYDRDPQRPRREVRAPAMAAPARAAMPLPQSGAPRLPASLPADPPFLSPAVWVWIRGGMIGLAGVVALLLASQAQGNGALYYGGLFFFLLCVLAVFRLVSARFDAAETSSPLLPVPEESTARYIRGGLLAVVAVVALTVAAKSHGAGLGYYGGLFAAACAVFYIFYLIHMSIGRGEEGEHAREG